MLCRFLVLALVAFCLVFPSAVRADDTNELARLRAENARLMADNDRLKDDNSHLREIANRSLVELQARTNELELHKQLVIAFKKSLETNEELVAAQKRLLETNKEHIDLLEKDATAFTKFWRGICVVSQDDAKVVDTVSKPPAQFPRGHTPQQRLLLLEQRFADLQQRFESLRKRLCDSLGQRKAACDILEEEIGTKNAQPEVSPGPPKIGLR